MKTISAILTAWFVAATATSQAGILDHKQISIDFTDPVDATTKATWSEPDKMTASKDGLGWDGESAGSRDGWVQTKPLALGLSWRPTYAVFVRFTIQPPPGEITWSNGQKTTPDAGDVYIRYSPDRMHWSSWQALQRAEPQSSEAKKKPGRYYGSTIRVPYRERREYDKLVSEYSRLDVPWKSDEEAAVQWILRRDPDFFSKHIPFIGYAEFLFEAGFPGGQRIQSFRAEISCGMGGVHSIPRDDAVYKERNSTPWRFEVKENLPAQRQAENPENSLTNRVPAETETEILRLRSTNLNERSDAIMRLRYLGMAGKAEAARPVLMQMLGDATRYPVMKLGLSSLSPVTQSCTTEWEECTFGGEAAETLARLGKPAPGLVALASNSNWRIRANAIRAIGGLKDPSMADVLLAVVEKPGEQPEVRGNAALALGALQARPAVPALIGALKDPDRKVRGSAASALGAIDDAAAIKPLIALLADIEPEVRIHVAMSLGRLGGPEVVDALLGALADQHRQVREVTARALGRAKDLRVVDALVTALKDEYANVRINAAASLGEIKDRRALEPLMAALGDNNEAVRAAVAAALGELGDERAIKLLAAMVLKEEREMPLLRGLEAMAKLGHGEAETTLREYRRHRADWSSWWNQNKDSLLGIHAGQ